MTRRLVFLIVAATLVAAGSAEARFFRMGMRPNAPAGCNACHTTGGGTPRNAFGLAVEALVTANGQEVFWGPELAALDSDGDGFTNGQELGDPDGDGVSVAGVTATQPGSVDSFPLSVVVTLDLTDMTPHLGQRFEARLVDRETGKEVDRVSVSSIASADFSVTFDGAPTGGDYDVDFYADLNKDGRYDAPPIDHAWRMAVDDAAGAPMLSFTHNTGFTDVEFPDYGGPAAGRHRALVTVTVTDNGTPVAGVDVEVSRSVSGRRVDYQWRATTDSNGEAETDIRVDPARYWRSGASGYYLIRAVNPTTGAVVGQWGSVPVNGGKAVAISLPVGGRASADGSVQLASAAGAVLEGNYPNPFNPSTQIRYELAGASDVKLTVYNSLGQEVARLVNARQASGRYSVTWDAKGAASGIYYTVMEAGPVRQTRSMVLLK